MSDKKRKTCYSGIFSKIDHIEKRINEIKEQLAHLKDGFEESTQEEICLDEVEAEQALLELMNDTAIQMLLETKSKGEG